MYDQKKRMTDCINAELRKLPLKREKEEKSHTWPLVRLIDLKIRHTEDI
jgi:hypothetical protein